MKKILRGLGVLLIFLGLLLFFNKPIQNYAVKQTTKKYDISTLNKEEIAKNKKRKGSFDFDTVEGISTGRIVASQISKQKKNLPVIASIAIPSVEIRLPIFNGISNENLLYGAGTMKEDEVLGKGNYALASHHSDQADLLFTPLERIEKGDNIYLTDLSSVYTYKVISKRIIDPTNVEVIEDVPGEILVTLVTCGDLSMKTRILVQGILEDETSMDTISHEAEEAFKLPVKSY